MSAAPQGAIDVSTSGRDFVKKDFEKQIGTLEEILQQAHRTTPTVTLPDDFARSIAAIRPNYQQECDTNSLDHSINSVLLPCVGLSWGAVALCWGILFFIPGEDFMEALDLGASVLGTGVLF